MGILKADGINKIYQTPAEEVKALTRTDLEIKEGDFVIINGPSGSGKTTLLNLLCGIDQPTSGSIYLNDTSLESLSDARRTEIRRDRIGLVFQGFELISSLNTWENVEYPLLLQNVSRKERKKRVDQILEQVGLSEMARRFPSQLSGGQKQRVAIARSLVTRPEIVLADEPTGNLDSETGEKIVRLMLDLNEQYGVAFIVVTHDLFINKYASKLFVIKDGVLTRKEVGDHVQDRLA